MATGDLSTIAIRLATARRAPRFGIVLWSPDGQSIAAAGGRDHASFRLAGDGVIWLWRLDYREPLLLEGHAGAVTDVRWSPDGSRLASGSDDGTVRVWDVASGAECWRLEGRRSTVWCVAWSPVRDMPGKWG